MVQNRSHDQVLPRCRTLITHPTDDESSRVESSRLPGHMEPTALSIDRMGVMISFSLGHRMNVSDPFLFFQGLCDDRERIVLFSRYRPQLAPRTQLLAEAVSSHPPVSRSRSLASRCPRRRRRQMGFRRRNGHDWGGGGTVTHESFW